MYTRHKSYRRVGLPWLEEAPAHWRLLPLWVLFRRERTIDCPTEQRLSVYRDFGVIPTDSRADNHNNPSEDLSLYQLVSEGDLVVNKMKAWQGSVGISEYRGIVSPAYFVYKPLSDQNSRFLHYLLRSQNYIAAYGSLSKGIRVGQWDLQPEYFTRLPILLPSISEQAIIADFLDGEMARIDALVAEEERLIALLQEQRQAVISHAVTKGLNPHAPMKESGVDWIGQMPANWELRRLGALASFQNGAAFSPAEWSDSGFPIIRIQNLNGGGDYNHFAGKPDPRVIVQSGDLLFGWSGNRGTSFGPFLWDKPGMFVLNQHIFRVASTAMSNEELFWTLRAVTAHIEEQAHGIIGLVHVTKSKLMSVIVPLPPRDERLAICAHIRERLDKTDAAMKLAEQSIALLRERRTALITAAVTGQIDVRGLVDSAA